jgi:undecaprenyl-phosphate 4-deoxy-4-formamido-L-arabinose transferase
MYSIVIPCYKSSATIETVVSTTADEMRRMGRTDFEFVLVNDGSPDGGKTIAKLRELVAALPYVRAVDLARNSGQHNATMAGLRTAVGDVFICMDDDLQTRPSELHKMFAAFDEGYDMVYGVYPQKKESASFGSES